MSGTDTDTLSWRQRMARKSPMMDIEDPAFRVLHNDLQAIITCVSDWSSALCEYVAKEAALLNSYLVEGSGVGGVEAVTGTSPFTFQAQTHDVEVITWLIAAIPATAQSVILQLDDYKIPLPAGEFTSMPCCLPVRKPDRTLSWTNVQTTDQPFILLTARPAPANIPGVLH